MNKIKCNIGQCRGLLWIYCRVNRSFDYIHNNNGPAVILTNGEKYWFVSGNLHRLNGPAIEDQDGRNNSWYIHGYEYKTELEYWIAVQITSLT